MEDEKITVLLCPHCGWSRSHEICKPQCPDCLAYLNIATGTQSEIDKEIDRVKTRYRTLVSKVPRNRNMKNPFAY